MSTQLNEDTLARVNSAIYERRLTANDKVAIYAFGLKKVPAKILARVFHIGQNSIYYITNWETTAAHEFAKQEFDRLGADRVWAEIVTQEQIEHVNRLLERLEQGKKLHDSRYSRINRSRTRARRARTAAQLPEAAGDGASGSAEADQRIPGGQMDPGR
jgi:hypothetical protein